MMTDVSRQGSRQVFGRAPAVNRAAVAAGYLLPAALFYMIAFPKAGIRIFEIPITFGYILSSLVFAFAAARAKVLAVPVHRLLILGVTWVLAFWSLGFLIANGTSSVGFTISYFTSIVYLPLFGLVVFSRLTMDEYGSEIEAAFRWAIRFVICYGIFLFFFKFITGSWIEIPYLTVNADDVGTLDDKYINRGGIFKLISTYNNGNIFGVAMCILGPLYLRLEPRRVFRFVFYVALVLTLSRTVWIGFIAILMMQVLSRRLSVLTAVYLLSAALFAGVAIYYALALLGFDLSFLFDRNLGGRLVLLKDVWSGTLVPLKPIKPLPEIVYTGIIANYGYIGLIFFLAFLLTPTFILKAMRVDLLATTKASACLQGLLLYSVLCAADGAFSYIPVMMIFWMIAGMGLWYAQNERRRVYAR